MSKAFRQKTESGDTCYKGIWFKVFIKKVTKYLRQQLKTCITYYIHIFDHGNESGVLAERVVRIYIHIVIKNIK